jgi:hypothetical protein
MKKTITIVAALIAVLIVGVATALLTIDVNTFKPQIIEVLGKQTGRNVKLGGPIKLGFSWHGVVLAVQDSALGNPAWASRPDMAGIGRFELGVALMPLLNKQLVIRGLKVENADILLETGAGDKHNWDMKPAGEAKPTPVAINQAPQKSADQSVSIHLDKLSVKNSQLAMRDKDGKTTIFNVASLTLGTEGTGGIAVHFTGEYNGAPMALNVKTGANDLMTATKWPLDADLTYANFKVKAKGTADTDIKKLELASYELTAGKSGVHGQLFAQWGDAIPAVRGTAESDKIDPADFMMQNKASESSGPTAKASSGPQRVFSDAPLVLDGLRVADAVIDIDLKEVTLKNASLKQISGKLILSNGLL